MRTVCMCPLVKEAEYTDGGVGPQHEKTTGKIALEIAEIHVKPLKRDV